MYKQITKDVAVTITKNRVHLHLKKYKPVIISAEDEFRKGIEVKICSKCKSVQTMVMSVDKRRYCEKCADEYFAKEKPNKTQAESKEKR